MTSVPKNHLPLDAAKATIAVMLRLSRMSSNADVDFQSGAGVSSRFPASNRRSRNRTSIRPRPAAGADSIGAAKSPALAGGRLAARQAARWIPRSVGQWFGCSHEGPEYSIPPGLTSRLPTRSRHLIPCGRRRRTRPAQSTGWIPLAGDRGQRVAWDCDDSSPQQDQDRCHHRTGLRVAGDARAAHPGRA